MATIRALAARRVTRLACAFRPNSHFVRSAPVAGNGRRIRSSRATSADNACAEPCNLSALDPMAPRSKGTTLVTRRVVVTVLLVAMGASAGSRSKAMPPAKPSSGDSAGSGADIRHGRPRPGELHVLVVDGSGAPLSGVSVSGDYQ